MTLKDLRLPVFGPAGRPVLFGLLAALLLLLVLLIVTFGAGADRSRGVAGARMIPELADRLDEVRHLVVETRSDRFAISRGRDGWGLADRGGYPVREELVRATLLGLTDLRQEAPRTANPDNYSRLQVEDPDRPGARSLRLTLQDGNRQPLASVILGKERDGGFGLSGTARYVRRAESEQSWLATGGPTVPRRLQDWLLPDFVDIAAARVAEIEIAGPGRPAVLLERDIPGREAFAPVGLPDGLALADPAASTALAGVLEGLQFGDVRPIAEVFFPADGPQVMLTTFDGLIVIARLGQVADAPGALWARFDIARVPRLHRGEAPGLLDAEAVSWEADSLNRRLSGWAYRLPADRARLMQTRWDDLTRPGPPAEPIRQD